LRGVVGQSTRGNRAGRPGGRRDGLASRAGSAPRGPRTSVETRRSRRRARACTLHIGPNGRTVHLALPRPRQMKRVFDASLALVGLVVSMPLWALFATAIKFDDGGPVFYTQERVGRNGRVFRALKFRSMHHDAERTTGPLQAKEGDSRITRVGKLMRATAMDE